MRTLARWFMIIPLLVMGRTVHAQNIGINANGAAPNASALLDIDGSALAANNQKGLLIPRVALTAINATAPVTAPATSLLIYNTSTAGVAPNNVTPGFYYWDGATWVRLLGGNPGWTLFGNAGTSPLVNFLGTTDAADFVVRTSNTERFRVMGATGRIGWGTTAPLAPLEVNSGGAADAIYGHSTNVGGWLGRETNISFGIPLQTIQGAGVYANNPTAGYTSAYSQSTGGATVAANINFSDVWIAQYNYVQNGTAAFNPPGTYSQLNVTNAALGGLQAAYRGYSDRGTTAGNIGWTLGAQLTAVSQNQDVDGIWATGISNSLLERVGGYFESNTYSGAPAFNYAFVGGVVGGIAWKINGTGAMAETVPTEDHGRVALFASEAPEYWYEDFGSVEMVNGFAHVDLDPILADIIVVDVANPIRVFCTPVGMPAFNGVTVMNRTATGFDLQELNGGTHSGSVDYHLIVKPKTNFGSGRFPQAHGPAWLKPDQEPEKAKAANQPDPQKIYHWPADWVVYGYDVEKLTPVGGVVMDGPNKGKVKVAEGVFRDGTTAERPGTGR
jgi:hypothetical protein